jgi:FlaA1/EpsC-like NDP-sugar epimerase
MGMGADEKLRPRAVPPAGLAGMWNAVARRSVRGSADVALLLLDAGLVVVAFTLMLVLRYETEVPADAWSGFRTFLLVAVPLQLVVNRLAGLYGPVWQHASIYEAQRILVAGGTSGVVLTWWVLLADRLVPLSVALTGCVIATGLMGVLRFQSRLFAYHRGQRVDAIRVLIVGAGESGSAMLREMERKPEAGVRPVAMLDDDPRKLGRWVGHVPIVGRVEDLPEVAERLQVEQVLLAVPSADTALVRRVADASSELGIALKVLPSVAELMNGRPRLTDVRDLSIDDLLGRQPIATDLDAVGAMIRGRRVLVTGGGGSIGSEIVRQVAAYGPARLVVLDRDETHLFDAMAEIDGAGVAALVDVRDSEQLYQLFLREQPEIVYHAAANKHVPLLEEHPCEAAATNVLGTENVVSLARTFGVEHLVFVSTDKAVRPSSVMGATKRLGEQVVLSDAPEGSRWCAVRFGNVLGSRGSVVPTFVRQIRQGGPVTVTDEAMTRYFMSIPEAVQLVLQAAALADGREVFMLDMGEPVRIVDLANRMIALAGYRVGVDIEVKITGLRPGEKLSEELHTEDEAPAPTSHPKLVRLSPVVPEARSIREVIGQLSLAIAARDDAAVRTLLFDGVGPDAAVGSSFDDQPPWPPSSGALAHTPRLVSLPPHAGRAALRGDATPPWEF